MEQMNWIVFYGYVSPDWVAQRDFVGHKLTYDRLEDATGFATTQIGKMIQAASKGMYMASTMEDPTAVVDVDVQSSYDEREFMFVITTDSSPFYFCRIIFSIAPSAEVVRIANILSKDSHFVHDPLSKFYMMDFYARNFLRGNVIYDNSRWFNDDSELWVCPHCKAVYTDFDEVVDDFVIMDATSSALVNHINCDGVMICEQTEAHHAIDKAIRRVNDVIAGRLHYNHNGSEYTLALLQRNVFLNQMNGLSPAIVQYVSDFLIGSQDKNVTTKAISLSRIYSEKILCSVQTDTLLLTTDDVGYLLAILFCMDYATVGASDE